MQSLKHYVRAAICSLNQHPLNFTNNQANIIKSIESARQQQCTIRIGPELEVSGYMCQDHFYEYDTVIHSWEVIGNIIKAGVTRGILCDIGMPVIHKNVLYNARVIILNGQILAIRPKMYMADGGNYFQSRWFNAWKRYHVEDFTLPEEISTITGQKTCKIGHLVIKTLDAQIGFQICEEGWVSDNPMIRQALDGVDIIFNSSASHIEQGKLARKIQLVKQLTQKHGGAYLYSNNRGCQGSRVLFDGGCMFSLNGKLQALSPIISLSNVSVTRVQFSLHEIKTYRMSSRSLSRSSAENTSILERVHANIHISSEYKLWDTEKAQPILDSICQMYEEPHVTYEPSMYIWDYLKKSRASGFFLALSGGADSACVALVVHNLCRLLYREIVQNKKEEVLAELRTVVGDPKYYPKDPKQICALIFFTAYLSTVNSSEQTKKRAQLIADEIGANHRQVDFQNIFEQYFRVGENLMAGPLRFKSQGGSRNQDLALQNVQARNRMTLTYLLAQLELESRGRPGFLLVLSSSNLDEGLRGYLTKYDCSSGDLNPIGSMSKNTLKRYLRWNSEQGSITFVDSLLKADPTAELSPLKQGAITQTDEQDMGMTYNELQEFGEIRKIQKLGPVSMFERLHKMKSDVPPAIIAQKVKHFFTYYGINRHKQTTITPSFHYQASSCDDNRFDMRPFLYVDWSFQFNEMDKRVAQLNEQAMEQQQTPNFIFQ